MDPDSYQIRVLYFLNPHLIWVEAVLPGGSGHDDFEQVGVYGIMPLECTLNMLEERLETQKSLDWMPGIRMIMTQALAGAAEVWFYPQHFDRRTSIFDNNIHKYGEIVIKTGDGQRKKLSIILTKTKLAYYDESVFFTELSKFNLKTKLDSKTTREVVKILEQAVKKNHSITKGKSVKHQTKVVQAAQELETALTSANINFEGNKTIDQVLQQKEKDFQLCKDIDEESFGRGHPRHRRRDDFTSDESTPNISESEKKTIEESEMFKFLMATKQMLMSKGKDSPRHRADIQNTPKVVENVTEKVDRIKVAAKKRADLAKAYEEGVAKLEEEMKKGAAKMWAKVPNFKEFPKSADETTNAKHGLNEDHVQRDNKVQNDTTIMDPLLQSRDKSFEDGVQNMNRRRKSRKSPKFALPSCDGQKQKIVAYGPPGFDRLKLSYQVVDKENDIPGDKSEDTENQGKPVAGFDSEHSVPITYKELARQSCENSSNDARRISQTDHVYTNIKVVSNGQGSSKNNTQETQNSEKHTLTSRVLAIRLNKLKLNSESSASEKYNSASSSPAYETNPIAKKVNDDSDDESITDLMEKLKSDLKWQEEPKEIQEKPKHKTVGGSGNQFKNVDPFISPFIEKLVSPVLMLHTKQNHTVQPLYDLRDISFNTYIKLALKDISVSHPMTIQTVSWFSILRGYSLFMVSPVDSGKTLGYIPAVCQLVADYDFTIIPNSGGPICVIVCATSSSVANVTRQCRRLLGSTKKVLSCNSATSERDVAIALLNGCDVFVSTPTALVKLMHIEDCVDLRRLATFVLDDFERLDEVYKYEIKFFVHKIKDMLKNRVDKELVQFIVASRTWCGYMESLAKIAPNSLVCIGSFQECVLYSKSNMQVSFVKRENKLESVPAFLETVDTTKRSVVVCRLDEEVNAIADMLKKQRHVVFNADDTMTVEDLSTLSSLWAEYKDPLLGPILVCCDGNLTHLNITDAHYLMHYSLPSLFSMFSRRFSVLIDNYPSMFRDENEEVKIKVLVDEKNVEQLPKILHFVKRCSDGIPEYLDVICKNVLADRDIVKAKSCVPFCENTLCFGVCPDFWYCQERHTLFKDFDEPKDWVPKNGVVTFRVVYYQSPVSYSARLLTHYQSGRTHKYPQAYLSLSAKMNMFYSKESNRQLHSEPKLGDLCAVSVKENFFERCQVVKILSFYEKNGNPNYVLVKMIDEEKWERTRDINLYYLPKEMKSVNTYVVQVKLANVKPKDRDVSFPDDALEMLMKLTHSDEIYMRSNVLMTIGNALIVDNLEACQSLASLKETVVRLNVKDELLKRHAIANPQHLKELETLCVRDGLDVKAEAIEVAQTKFVASSLPSPRWAHLDADFQLCYFASTSVAVHPGRFFVRLEKFENCLDLLTKDVQKYIAEKTPEAVASVDKNSIVLALFPDDSLYYRARVDKVVDDNKVRCFFVDHGDWREVQRKNLMPITEAFITKMPFQAIECRLFGISPVGQKWNEFSSNWFCDQCFLGSGDDLKPLYVKYFTKESAECTGGYKYGVAIIDTTTEKDVVINKAMIDNNLARDNANEIEHLEQLDFKRKVVDSDEDSDWESEGLAYEKLKQEMKAASPTTNTNLDFLKQPIRSVPLVENYDQSDGEWDIEMSPDVLRSFLKVSSEPAEFVEPKPKTNNILESLPTDLVPLSIVTQSDSSSKLSDFEVIPSPKCTIKELNSDDFSSPEPTEPPLIQEVSDVRKILPGPSKAKEEPHLKTVLTRQIPAEPQKTEEPRKPKICWRQSKTNVSLRIELIGVEKYDLEIGARHLKFSTTVHDTQYAFELELYCVIDTEKSLHDAKGLYILVKLTKRIPKTWLSLTRDGGLKKWIVFDADSIDSSCDEDDEATLKTEAKKVIEEIHNNQSDDDDDGSMVDDTMFRHRYRRGSD